MIASRLATALVVAVSAVGAGGVVAGCGTKDIPGGSQIKEQAQKAIDAAQKELDKAKKEADNAPADQRDTAQQAVEQAQKALDAAQKRLDSVK